jgi:hypothetical protein
MTQKMDQITNGQSQWLGRPSRLDGRLIVAGALFSCLAAICLAGWNGDASKAWRWLGVVHLWPRFTDARAITGGWDSWRMGCDPLYENPGHPCGSLMNYPRLWLVPSIFGFGGGDTTVLACCAVAAFWLMSFLLMGRLTPGEGCVYALLMCSPAAMLAVERGNSDLILFILVACGIFLLQSRPSLGYGLFLLAGFLKLFPIFALSAAMRERKRLALITIGVVGTAFLVYIALTFPDFVQIWRASSHSGVASYGCTTFAYKIEDSLNFRGLHPGYLRWVFAFGLGITIIVLMLSVRSGLRLRHSSDASTRELDAFRIGASIYVGTFLLGSNYEYRLIFLLLTIPQLLIWIKDCKELRLPATRAFWFVIAIMWSTWGLAAVPPLRRLIIPVAELVNWALFALFVMLLVAILPAWIWEMVEVVLPKHRQRLAVT